MDQLEVKNSAMTSKESYVFLRSGFIMLSTIQYHAQIFHNLNTLKSHLTVHVHDVHESL